MANGTLSLIRIKERFESVQNQYANAIHGAEKLGISVRRYSGKERLLAMTSELSQLIIDMKHLSIAGSAAEELAYEIAILLTAISSAANEQTA